MSIMRTLDILFEEETCDISSDIIHIVHELDQAKQRVLDLQNKVQQLKRKMTADIALQSRKQQPGLDIDVSDDSCTLDNGRKAIQVTPDFNQKAVIATPGGEYPIDKSVDNLVKSVLKLFGGLQFESKGRLSINNKQVNIIQLKEWRDG